MTQEERWNMLCRKHRNTDLRRSEEREEEMIKRIVGIMLISAGNAFLSLKIDMAINMKFFVVDNKTNKKSVVVYVFKM